MKTKLTLFISASALALALVDEKPESKHYEEKLHEAFDKENHDAKDWPYWKQTVNNCHDQYANLNRQPAPSEPPPAPKVIPTVPRPPVTPEKAAPKA